MQKKLHFKSLWWFLGTIQLGLVAYVSLIPKLVPPGEDIPNIDKLWHCACYTLLGLWFCGLLPSRLTTGLLVAAFGISMEVLQKLGGHRFFELWDIAANTVGAFIGAWLCLKLHHWPVHFLDGWLAKQKWLRPEKNP